MFDQPALPMPVDGRADASRHQFEEVRGNEACKERGRDQRRLLDFVRFSRQLLDDQVPQGCGSERQHDFQSDAGELAEQRAAVAPPMSVPATGIRVSAKPC